MRKPGHKAPWGEDQEGRPGNSTDLCVLTPRDAKGQGRSSPQMSQRMCLLSQREGPRISALHRLYDFVVSLVDKASDPMLTQFNAGMISHVSQRTESPTTGPSKPPAWDTHTGFAAGSSTTVRIFSPCSPLPQ